MTDPEIVMALSEAGLEIRSAVAISVIRSPEIDRVAYRIETADRVIKARRLESADAARRLVSVRGDLPDAFTRVLSRHGRVLLEEWVDGDPLGHPPDASTLQEAGALLSALHGRCALHGRALHFERDTAGHRAEAVRALDAVVRARGLAADAAASLGAAMERLDPGVAPHGLVHLDFGGKNMVVDRQGRLRVVDNERVGIDALGFDLARAWYRWALPPSGWDRFARAYERRLPVAGALDAQGFWRIVAAARAAALRLRVCPDRADAPLACLRALVSSVAS